ncbi:16S rRNA (guanine(527)-N(7))-methyltransferase RsmG [Myroides odoratus]|uniref:16S rRNA (guanine(527)-N(7))-methyltransferase RsmG n=1 Tax=Myroides odoratus TaxID=256 RepID=UPI0039AEE320
MEEILKYFPDLTPEQITQFEQLENVYNEWNAKINVISRKDIQELYVKHVLHALGIAKVMEFVPGSSVMDVGTGGGFPGIPLAILYPETQFYLIDILAKKILVVNEVVQALGLKNVVAEQKRAENVEEKFDFIVSRAVTNMPEFVKWIRHRTKKENKNEFENGVLYLKGGDLTEELQVFPRAVQFDLSHIFDNEFFETKKVVYLPLKYKG